MSCGKGGQEFIAPTTMFNVKNETGSGRPFLSTASRFDYFRTPQKQDKKHMPDPSPGQYRLRNTFGPESFKQNAAFSMGQGRGNMKKIYIDDIMNKADKENPGPGRYNDKPHFGKAGLEYSFAAKLKRYERPLEDSGKLPGPG